MLKHRALQWEKSLKIFRENGKGKKKGGSKHNYTVLYGKFYKFNRILEFKFFEEIVLMVFNSSRANKQFCPNLLKAKAITKVLNNLLLSFANVGH